VTWTEQTETIVKAWTDTQEQIWKNWLGLVPGVPSPGEGARFAENVQIVNDVTRRLLTAQKEMLRILEMSLRTWNAIAPKIEAGEDWHQALLGFTDELRQHLLQFPLEMQKGLQDSDELWRLYYEQWKGLVQPWVESLRQAPWHFGQASAGDGSALIEFTNLYWDAYERTFGRLLESPSLGYTRELNADMLKGFDAWMEYRRASFEYQVMLTRTWIQAFETFMQQVPMAAQGEPGPGVRKLLFLWLDVVEQAFTGVFRSKEYLRIQANLVNTATAYRLREREIVDAFLKTSHLPSRSELDEAYRRIYELRKEVKDLRKAVHALQGEPQPDRQVI
jgi:class III poly(R)-hydroxyalkanoic acid synthase PhaE subunit